MAIIPIHPETKKALDQLKIHPRETYDQITQRLIKRWKETTNLEEEPHEL